MKRIVKHGFIYFRGKGGVDGLKCDKPGLWERGCTFTCSGDETCSVKASLNRCSCSGVPSELCDKAVYNMETGKKITPVGLKELAEVHILGPFNLKQWLHN